MCTINQDMWCMVPKTGFFNILGHFSPFDPHNNPNQNFGKIIIIKKNAWRYHFTLVYHKWQSHDVLFLRYWAQQTECFVILGYFCPFTHPNNPPNQNFEKMEKVHGDIILHMSIITENHLMYDFRDTECNRIFLIWSIFWLPPA